jgi:hypothetical protein
MSEETEKTERFDSEKLENVIDTMKHVDFVNKTLVQDAQAKIHVLEIQVKEPIINSLVKDSVGYYKREDLEKLGIDDLKTLSDALKNAISCGCKDALEEHKRMLERKSPVRGRVGSFNQETGEWEGGEIV